MPYGDYVGRDKPNKGLQGGACNRARCQDEPANWWNRGSFSWYCADCARALNADAFNARESAESYGGAPLCVYVEPGTTLTPERARRRRA